MPIKDEYLDKIQKDLSERIIFQRDGDSYIVDGCSFYKLKHVIERLKKSKDNNLEYYILDDRIIIYHDIFYLWGEIFRMGLKILEVDKYTKTDYNYDPRMYKQQSVGLEFSALSNKSIMTIFQYHNKLKELDSSHIYIIKDYACYTVVAEDADKLQPICDEIMMLDYGGRNFVYDTDNYSYHFLSFGNHNLQKLCNYLDDHNMPYSVINDMKWHDVPYPTKKDYASMAEYEELKKKYPDTTFLFRYPLTYCMYKEDARKALETLEDIPFCAKPPIAEFSNHMLDVYMPKLIRAGLRVAIIDPKKEERPAPPPPPKKYVQLSFNF